MLQQPIYPMEPIASKTVPVDRRYLYQIKWDGIRVLSFLEDNQLRLRTRKGNDCTRQFPELHQLQQLLNAESTVLDGEVIALNDNHRPDFELLLTRMRTRDSGDIGHRTSTLPVYYFVFDILHKNGHSLIKLPLEQRQQILQTTVREETATFRIVGSFRDGPALYDAIRSQGLEGIIAKERDSMYYPGEKRAEWIKVKCWRKQYCVAGGLAYKGEIVSSLLAGAYRNNKLFYVGRVSSGLTERDKAILNEFALTYGIAESPFLNTPSSQSQKYVWLPPMLTFESEFICWTHNGMMRSPRITGFGTFACEQCTLEGRE